GGSEPPGVGVVVGDAERPVHHGFAFTTLQRRGPRIGITQITWRPRLSTALKMVGWSMTA
ncbi:MAG: hypothetical protein V4529_17270, partial [Gemmatimonadota bacterium]